MNKFARVGDFATWATLCVPFLYPVLKTYGQGPFGTLTIGLSRRGLEGRFAPVKTDIDCRNPSRSGKRSKSLCTSRYPSDQKGNHSYNLDHQMKLKMALTFCMFHQLWVSPTPQSLGLEARITSLLISRSGKRSKSLCTSRYPSDQNKGPLFYF